MKGVSEGDVGTHKEESRCVLVSRACFGFLFFFLGKKSQVDSIGSFALDLKPVVSRFNPLRRHSGCIGAYTVARSDDEKWGDWDWRVAQKSRRILICSIAFSGKISRKRELVNPMRNSMRL